MGKERLLEFSAWLNIKLIKVDEGIIDAKKKHNYGKATQYSGMRDAYLEVIEKVNLEISILSKAN